MRHEFVSAGAPRAPRVSIVMGDMNSATITPATDAISLAEVRSLFLEYAASLEVDLAYQDFQREVATLPGDYAPPRGCLLLGRHGAAPVACIAVRPLDDEVCEMKRLFVRSEARGSGIGRELAMRAIEFGRTAGFRAMRLDTLPSMVGAQRLYKALGFREIMPYRFSPVPGNVYMELVLVPPPV